MGCGASTNQKTQSPQNSPQGSPQTQNVQPPPPRVQEAPPLGKMESEILLSGGGFRACSSSAVIALAMMQKGIWQKAEKATGVSGGSWFLIALARGRLRGISEDVALENVLRMMEEAEITQALSAEEREQLEGQILRGTEEIIVDDSDEKPCTKAGRAMLWIKQKIDIALFRAASPVVKAAICKILDFYGTIGAFPVHPEPVEAMQAFMKETILGDDGHLCYIMQNPKGPALHAACITPCEEEYYAWIDMPVCGVPAEHTTFRVTHPAPPQTLLEKIRADCHKEDFSAGARCKNKAFLQRTKDKGTSVVDTLKRENVISIPASCRAVTIPDTSRLQAHKFAAITGSAIAVDMRYMARSLGIDVWNTKSFFPNDVTPIEPAVIDGQNVTIEMRDAGIDVNLPYILAGDTEICWAIDASNEEGPEVQIELAMELGHLPEYTRVDVKGRKDCALYRKTNVDDCRCSPKLIAIIVGLTDDCTMEPLSTDKRREMLRGLFTNAMGAIDDLRDIISSVTGKPL